MGFQIPSCRYSICIWSSKKTFEPHEMCPVHVCPEQHPTKHIASCGDHSHKLSLSIALARMRSEGRTKLARGAQASRDEMRTSDIIVASDVQNDIGRSRMSVQICCWPAMYEQKLTYVSTAARSNANRRSRAYSRSPCFQRLVQYIRGNIQQHEQPSHFRALRNLREAAPSCFEVQHLPMSVLSRLPPYLSETCREHLLRKKDHSSSSRCASHMSRSLLSRR
jgi:hypothetical protein